MAFVIPEAVTYAELQKIIKKSAQSNLFKGSEIFDVYQGEHIKDGFKSLAFRIKLQDENSTLTEDVIEKQKTLQPGTCVAFGKAFKVPLIIRMELPNPEPHSSNAQIYKNWMIEWNSNN